jgi:Domain of unknown function (DUF6471)
MSDMPMLLSSQKRRICYLTNDFVRVKMVDGRDEWANRARRYLKAELKRAEVTYEELARRLGDMGIEETKGSVTVKVNRGAFPAWFLFAAMKAIGVEQVRLEDI